MSGEGAIGDLGLRGLERAGSRLQTLFQFFSTRAGAREAITEFCNESTNRNFD